jgi:hypothetical protein
VKGFVRSFLQGALAVIAVLLIIGAICAAHLLTYLEPSGGDP